MNKPKTETKVKGKSTAQKLNEISAQPGSAEAQSKAATPANAENSPIKTTPITFQKWQEEQAEINEKYEEIRSDVSETVLNLFDSWESGAVEAQDFRTEVNANSIEASIGYSSLLRQMHRAFINRVAFYRSEAGGALSPGEARKAAFHPCTNKEEAKKELNMMLSLPLESLSFSDLMQLQSFSPRAAEKFWERAKREGRKEFESGHLAANIAFPVGYMKGVWNIARYLGLRDSFIDDWKPQGGIEIALIDMMAQSYFQWQYWLEQTVKRSETQPRREHPEYEDWQRHRKMAKKEGWMDGYWLPPTVSERDAVEHAVLMADRFNRIFMRTLRQLRDLRRYAPVTINNPNQVNIAANGGQQVNVNKSDST